MEILELAFEAARSFGPMGAPEITKLLAKTAQAATTGDYELFKQLRTRSGSGMNLAECGS